LLILPSKNLKDTLKEARKTAPDILTNIDNCERVGTWLNSIKGYITKQEKENSVIYWLCDRLIKELATNYYKCREKLNIDDKQTFGQIINTLSPDDYVSISDEELTGFYNVMNKAMKKQIPQLPLEKWREFFTCFALNDISDLNIGYDKEKNGFTIGNNKEPFAKQDEKYLFYLVEGCKYDLPVEKGVFADVCLYNWLQKLDSYCGEKYPELKKVVENVSKAVKTSINDSRKLDG